MALSIEDIHQIGSRIAAEYGSDIDVLCVASNQGGEGRVEVLVTIAGERQPDRVLLNLARTNRETFERTLRAMLQSAMLARQA
jgi:hypothetical protein